MFIRTQKVKKTKNALINDFEINTQGGQRKFLINNQGIGKNKCPA
jgi:hypothetical protein